VSRWLWLSRSRQAGSPVNVKIIMFLARLDDAKEALTSEVHITPVKDKKASSSSSSSAAKSSSRPDSERAVPDPAKEAANYKLLDDMTEYLFDLFDANMMPEFQQIQAFEDRAVLAFDGRDGQDEYTLEQSRLHGEFLSLFESLLEKFLQEQDITIDTFYELVQWYHKQTGTKMAHSEKANEVLEVVDHYMTFELWADGMKELARHRSKYMQFKEQMQTALDTTKAVAKDHRLADAIDKK
jgi:The ARF-like 2 binding protein BART